MVDTTINDINSFSISLASGFSVGSIYRNGLNMIEVVVIVDAFDLRGQSIEVGSDQVKLVNWDNPNEIFECIVPEQANNKWSYFTEPNEFCSNSIPGAPLESISSSATILHYYVFCPAPESRENITFGARINTVKHGQLTICKNNGYIDPQTNVQEPGAQIQSQAAIDYSISSRNIACNNMGTAVNYNNVAAKTEYSIAFISHPDVYIKTVKTNALIQGFASNLSDANNIFIDAGNYNEAFANSYYSKNHLMDWYVWFPNDNTLINVPYNQDLGFQTYQPPKSANAMFMASFDRYTGVKASDGMRAHVCCVQLFDQWGNSGVYSFLPRATGIVDGLNYGPGGPV